MRPDGNGGGRTIIIGSNDHGISSSNDKFASHPPAQPVTRQSLAIEGHFHEWVAIRSPDPFTSSRIPNV